MTTNGIEHAAPPVTSRVVVVDDHDLLRRGVIAALSGFDDIEVVGQASDGETGVAVALEQHPDVVLMDLVMPAASGVDAIRAIKDASPDIEVLALTSYAEASLVRRALAAGATSYLMKDIDAPSLAHAVRTTARGQSTLAPEVSRQLANVANSLSSPLLDRLTDREVEVAELLAQGRSNAEIATELDRSLYTVKNHVSNVLMKLQVRSRTEATALLHRDRSLAGSPEHHGRGSTY